MTAAGSLQTDVLVVGGGLAGALAALAARDAGATVALARRSPGATALSSGAVSVAPDPTALPSTTFAARAGTVESARRLAALQPGHPYAAVGVALDRLWESLEFAARELPLLAPPSPRPRWLATPSGSARPCGLCQRSMVAGDLAEAKGILAVVAPRGHLWFDAGLVAGGVNRLAALGAPRAVIARLDLFMWEEAALGRPHDLARLLEAPGAAEAVGAMLRRSLPAGAAAALFPPLLGLSTAARVPERIAHAAGIPVAEFLSDLPSVPGLRLAAAIDERLAAAGVELVRGELAGRGPGEAVSAGGREVRARSWVLASGRFVGGGIARRGTLVEPLLGIPVLASDGPFSQAGAHLASRPAASLTRRDSGSAQPLLSAGLKVDADLRPLGLDGRPVHERLFAAGAVIGGHDQAADGTGLGVAVFTGYLAGRSAAAAGGRLVPAPRGVRA